MQILRRQRKPSKWNTELVTPGGFEGYYDFAKVLAYKYFRFGFDSEEDRNQAAALAALEAVQWLGPDETKYEVARVVRRVLNNQVKNSTWRMINYRKPGTSKRSAFWGRREVMIDDKGNTVDEPRPNLSEPWLKRRSRPRYVAISAWGRKAIKPLDELLIEGDDDE